jgi:hypothetical protein
MTAPHQQFQAIQSMLAAGHRCVHLERHTLLLIGGVGGFLSVSTEWVITAERFPSVEQRGLALLIWLGLWLGGMAALEHDLTRRARARRDETLPFAQAQVTRAWWMLLSAGVLGSFAMVFHGGGSMVYALCTVLLGLGIYFYGLFSRPLIEWIGLAAMLLGVAGLAAGLPYGATRWINASSFAIGMPLAGWLNARGSGESLPHRVAILLFWLAVVVTPPLLVQRFHEVAPPGAADPVLRLPAGASIPLRADLEGGLLSISPQASLLMTLNTPVEVALSQGQPDGRYRVGDGAWHRIRDGVLRLRIDRVTPQLEGGSPEVRMHAVFEIPQGEQR